MKSFKVKNNPSGDIKQIPNNAFKMLTVNNSPKTFASLCDLSSNHLKNIRGSCSIPASKSSEIARLQSTNCINSADTVDKNTLGNIDLTKALIKDASQKSVTNLSKKFDYLDVNCKKDTEISDDYSCMMDISFILKKKSVFSKKVSPFGRILCRKYKKFVPVFSNNKKQSSKFLFDVLSPDDLIMSYLRT